jgi:hypothetical protein
MTRPTMDSVVQPEQTVTLLDIQTKLRVLPTLKGSLMA